MKKIQDNQGQVKVFLQKSRTIEDSFENPGHSRTFQGSGHHVLVNVVSGFRLELMYISLIVSIRSNLTHLHGFQQLVLVP